MTYKNINVVTKFSFLRREQLNFKVSSHHYKNSLVVMLFTYLFIYTYLYRSGGRCPKKFAKFIGKHLCQSLVSNKVADHRP